MAVLGTCAECGAPASVSYEFTMTGHLLIDGVETTELIEFRRWVCAGTPQHFLDMEKDP